MIKPDYVTSLPENYCGTNYAAKLLGLSVGTIHKLVDNNQLTAWKTKGGHRRILIQSIRKFQEENNISSEVVNPPDIDKRLRVLLVEDDDITREMLLNICNNSASSLDCTALSSGVEALIDIASIQPDILVTDLDMPGVDGFELVRILQMNTQFKGLAILALSAMSSDEIEDRGGIPEGCVYMQKPIKSDWFNGFFTGVIMGSANKQKLPQQNDRV